MKKSMGKRNRNVQETGGDGMGWRGVPLLKGKGDVLFLKLTGENTSAVTFSTPLYTINKCSFISSHY